MSTTSNAIPQYTNAYTPDTGLFNYASNNQLSNPSTVGNQTIDFNTNNAPQTKDATAGNDASYFDPSQLRDDIYNGVKASTNETYNDSLNSLNNTMANSGLFRSGLTLANQSKLEGEKMDALAKGYADAAYNVADLQNQSAIAQAQLDNSTNLANANAYNNAYLQQYQTAADQAKTQAQLNFDASKYNADIQNSWDEQNNTNLINAKTADTAAVNDAAKYNIQIQSGYDQMAYDYAKSLLQSGLTDKTNLMDYINTMTNAVMQSSDTASKAQWLKDLPGLLSDATGGLSSNYGLGG